MKNTLLIVCISIFPITSCVRNNNQLDKNTEFNSTSISKIASTFKAINGE